MYKVNVNRQAKKIIYMVKRSYLCIKTCSENAANATKLKWFKNGLRNTMSSPYSPDLNPIKHLWDVLNKQVQSMEAPLHNLQDLKDMLLKSWSQILQYTSMGLVESMLRWVRAVLAAKEGQHNIRKVVIMLCPIRNVVIYMLILL